MSVHWIAPAVLATMLFAAGATASARHPKISMKEARAKALAAVPHGHIRSAELETEKGRLIYSFDIEVPNRPGVEEVQISAIDGKLVSLRHETPAAEAREARSESKAQQKH